LPKCGGWLPFSLFSRASMYGERWRWQLASEDCLLFFALTIKDGCGFLLPFGAELSSEHLFVPGSSAIVTFPGPA
jgi:hypothetical protein